MSSAQRIAVWNGERAQTTGGLKKADLMRNRHGRIVSKRKSEVARRLNNLGNFLANKAKGAKAAAKPAAKPAPKPKPKPKPAKQPVAVKPKPKPVAVKPKPKGLAGSRPKGPAKQPKPVAVDPALVPPKIDKRLKKKPAAKKKAFGFGKKDYGFGAIDLTGGRLRKVTQKQLDRAKKKPVPRRAKKKRTRRKPSLGLTV